LETLAIIAYRQPIGRIEVEYIRGVGSSGVIRTLQDRRLIDVVGRGEGLGRPLLYGTTNHFLAHFGFKSLEDLPRPDELPIVLRERIPLEPEGDDESEGDGEDEDESGPVDELPEGWTAEEDGAVESGADGDAGQDAGADESDEAPVETDRVAQD